MPFSVACDDSLRHLPAKRRSFGAGAFLDRVFVLAVEVLELERLLEFLFMKSGSSLRKMPYTAQKNVCITFGSRVRFALENVLRFAGVMPRTRDSSAEYIFETSTISLRLNRCRNCESISRYTCELYENFLALTFSPDAISSGAIFSK